MLYICATPIGNMDDITIRSLDILKSADIILCEDTRNSQKLLNHHGIAGKKLIALHEHNENEVANKVVEWLSNGQTIVQISDAGTPGISDPGARLCNVAYKNGFMPHPLPGACAYLSLLSVSGLVDTQSLFYGFLPNKSSQRQKQLLIWKDVDYAVTIYESPHRIVECIDDILSCYGENRVLVVGREITKQFETITKLPVKEYKEFLLSDNNQRRGEFVINILPDDRIKQSDEVLTKEQIDLLKLLSSELPAKKAVNIAAKIVNGNKDLMYQYLIDMKNSQ